MKKLYLFSLLTSLVINLQSQTFDWAKREGLWAYDYGYGIVNDNLGNVYVAGKYEENAIFSGRTITNQGNHDMFLVKYSSSGVIDWTRTAGGSLGDYAHGLAIDAANNLVVAGEIEGYGNLITFEGSTITFNCKGDNDIFLAKYDLNGTLLWAKTEGYHYSEKGLAVTTDVSGNIYVCGYYTDSTKINGTLYVSKGGRDMYLAKYSPSGNFLWVQSAGSMGRDEALSVKCDALGNVYVCGLHSEGANFSGQILTTGPTSYIDYDIFLAKYNSAGVMQWVNSPGSDVDDVAWSITMDNAGKIYVAGEYNAYAVFGGFSLMSAGNADAYVACYDEAGTTLWVKSAGGLLIDRIRGIGCDGTNLYVTGQFGGTASFGTFAVTAADSSDVFIAALNSSGDFIWATSIGGVKDSVETLGYESGNSVCAQLNGSVYATGAVLDGGIFGATTYGEYARTDIFVTKILAAGVGISDKDKTNEIQLYPNPNNGSFTLDLDRMNTSENELIIYNYLGQVVEQQICASSKITIDLAAENKGVYFIKVISDQKVYRTKVIVQ